ncbi:MAG TPA: ABC transporter substrate-binding protein [Stellaceae bacterium]|nr:ABC transporter substrate-binding protein [Stellaceae bacterium]
MTLSRPVVAFLLSLAALVSLPDSPRAEDLSKLPHIGLIGPGQPGSGPLGPAFFTAFARHGYVADKSVVFVAKGAQGQVERLPSLVDELVASHVNVIISSSYPAAVAAKQHGGTTPIVLALAADPVATHLVDGLARPGGNITGLTEIATELSAKRLQLLKETVPSIHTVAVLWNEDDLAMTLRYRAAADVAPGLGVTIIPLGVRAPDDFDAAFAAMTKSPPDAILMVTDILTNLNRRRIIDFAAAHRLPSIFEYEAFAQDGGLMSYGPDLDDISDRVATLTDRILHGVKPADLPIELPTRFRFAINLKTAKAIGVTVPQSILARADDVIE